MTTEHMPIGGNVQHNQTEHISLEKAGWKMHLQAISILLKKVFIKTIVSDLHGSWRCALDPGAC